MKRYFEYPINKEIKSRLRDYYQDDSLDQHGKNHLLKSDFI